MYSLGLVAIFKNENHIFNEWIKHYINEGVEHFYLINNNSTDNFLKILQPYINSKQVTLVNDSSIYKQTFLYNKYFLEKCKKECEWVLVCDLDEFIYARNKYKTIKSYVTSFNDTVSQIYIPWKMFSSNNHINQPKSVIEGFTLRSDYNKKTCSCGCKIINNVKRSLVKCIVNTKYLTSFGIHNSIINGGTELLSNRQKIINDNYKSLQYIDENKLKDFNLNCNHYAIQSLEWFKTIKMTRGSANSQGGTNTKSKIEYFYSFDKTSSDINDYELKNKKYN